MGLKYVETVKSIILLLLVLLSIIFTFSIWTYTPRVDPIETLSTVDISIADKMKIEEIVKPYKLVFNYEDKLTGTSVPLEMDTVLNEMKKWVAYDVELVDSNFNMKKTDELLRRPNTLALYFLGEVPLPVYNNVLKVEEQNIPETSFDRLIIDWNSNEEEKMVYFVGRTNGLLYSAKLKLDSIQNFQQTIVNWGKSLGEYADIGEDHRTFIAVPMNTVETVRNSYYEEEINPTRFRDALFSDPNAVRRSQVGTVHEEFGDDHALMSIDTDSKMLSYVLPAAESDEAAIPSNLLFNTIDFVNEHGGWTDEFRFTYMNPITRYVKFQLFVHGLPVYSDVPGATEIAQIWGDNRNFRYIRPYYTIDLTLPETEIKQLLPGTEAVKILKNSPEIDFDTIEEITPGYYMQHDKESKLVTMEPAWFYLAKGNWNRISPDQLGGDPIGLE